MSEARTWHVDDPSTTIAFPEAAEQWARAALTILRDIARRPFGYITEPDLAERLQEATGLRTHRILSEWIGHVVTVARRRAIEQNLAPLTALVVQAETGEVSPAYHNRDRRPGTMNPEALQQLAAQDRMECYRVHGAALPADAQARPTPIFKPQAFTQAALHGIRPAVKKTGQKKGPAQGSAPSPGKRRSPRPVDAPAVICRNCFMQVPASGVCDSCGETVTT